jgi:excisionase family DNA binding protein
VATLQIFATYWFGAPCLSGGFGGSRELAGGLAHLLVMDTRSRDTNPEGRAQLTLIEQVLSLSELCTHLGVSAQTIYDLRCQGRGPRGFRVGRELRFRISEVQAWLDRMEQDDDRRHVPGRH